jgi:HAD superfamily hydrolase (TIGR01509 family)
MDEHSIKAVIFDCDGTLVDSETLSLAVLVQHVAEFGLEISHAEAMERFAGNELSVVFSEFEDRLGRKLPEDFLHTFRSRQMGVLREQLQPVAGVHDLLDAMQVPFCVASNAPVSKIQLCLETVDLIHHFDESVIFSAYQIKRWKPEPDLFLMAAERMQVAPQHCAVVEDSVFGIKAGLAAGMQVYGYDPHENLTGQFENVQLVRSLSELQRLLYVIP